MIFCPLLSLARRNAERARRQVASAERTTITAVDEKLARLSGRQFTDAVIRDVERRKISLSAEDLRELSRYLDRRADEIEREIRDARNRQAW